jgi:crotonobetainyl-CoA:carnitine CoA-transferase CaiB-like acyl-CoA transferase
MCGKRSILTDVTAPGGREVFEKLVKSVDVIVWNAPDRQVVAMGLDAEGLRKLNPDAIFCKLDCYSGPREGPRTGYLGYDDLVQAATGIMLRFGGGMETPEEHAHVGTIDVMCGFGGSLGIAAALYQKLKTGRIGRPRTSLSASSGLAQMPFCYDFEGRGPFDEPAGRDINGYGPLNRFYPTASDSFILLSAREEDIARFEGVEGLGGFTAVSRDERAAFLGSAFMTADAAEWVQRLQGANIAAGICDNIETIRDRSSRLADGNAGTQQGSYAFSIYEDHPSGHVVTQVDPYAVRSLRSRIKSLESAEKFGASTRSVLLELGYDDKDIDAMIESGAISESWSVQYLPS